MFKRQHKNIILFIFALYLAAVLFTPVYQLSISSGGKLLFSYPVASLQMLHTGYIHSVQLTPVEDDYRIVDSRLWLWEERIVSHNAGLPFEAPVNGRFFSDDKWMYVRGGRYNWSKVNLRVGSSDLGKNWMELDPFSKVDLYKILPGHLLQLDIREKPLVISFFSETKGLFSNVARNRDIP